MKALATQRLMEQVSSLEKNVNKMTVSKPPKKPTAAAQPMDIYTVIVDVTAFLDGLANVKRWANQTLNIRRRVQTSILQVIVPLEVIDVLDYYKKGDSHMNLQARESIRYLDHQLAADDTATSGTRSYLRTQKVDEKLGGEWELAAAAFWIGDKQVKAAITALTDSDDDDDTTSMSSDDDLFKSHGRGRQWASDDDDDSEEDEEDDYSTDDNSTDDDDDDDDGTENEEGIPPPVSPSDVPKTYRPLLSCLLYFYQQRPSDAVDPVVLVTNDDALAAWAERFGDPSTGKPISVYTVREWDRVLNTRTFERAADPSRSHK
jgi:hypothetical protein